MQENYWSRFTNKRIGRRRALAATGSVAAAAAFLAACGGDDDDGGTTGGTTGGGATGGGTAGGGSGGGGGAPAGLLTQPSHIPPAQAKRGGVLKSWARGEPRNLDPLSAQAGLNNQEDMVYELLLDEQPGKLEPSGYVLTGRLAESWEISSDGLQITFKLRPGVKWHNIAPVNGRDFDSSDVVAALERYAEIGSLSTVLYDSAGAGGPILSVEAPDARTVIVTQKEPINYTLNYFAPFGGFTATQIITPREANDNSLDVRTQMVGTGPYYLSNHEPSVRFEYKKFEEYWDADNHLVDEIIQPILPEYITRLTQLQAGEVYWGDDYNSMLRATDVLNLKNDQPDILLYEGPFNLATSVFTFGSQGVNPPYEDERVRQAISMSVDRDLDIDVRNNVDEFEEAGIPINKVWNSHMRATDGYVGGNWQLDPRDASAFGENAKYFQYNVPEAKKLLVAAGYPDGFEVPLRYPATAVFDRQTQVEPYFFYLQEIGLTVVQNGLADYTQDYIPNDRDASGAYEGIGYHSVTGGVPSLVSPVSSMVAEYWPGSGVTFHGFSAGGGTGKTGDPALTEILDKARLESDLDSARSLIHEAQRYLGKAMWAMMESGGSPGIYAAWPAVQNFRVWSATPSSWRHYQIWLDDTKAPLA